MRAMLVTALFLLALAANGLAGEPSRERALVTRMRMAPCSAPVSRNFITSLMEQPAPMGQTPFQCPEYLLETSTVRYRVRPRKDVLVPVGQKITFRFQKRDMILVSDDQEVACSVMEMKLLGSSADDEREQASAVSPERVCLAMDGTLLSCPPN